MNEDKATRYHRLRRRAQVASLAAAGLSLAAIAVGPPHLWLRDICDALTAVIGVVDPWRRAVRTAIGAAVITLAIDAVALPFAYYLGYVLQHRYGLSRQSSGEWWRDHLKAAVIAATMAAVAGVVVYEALHRWPGWWWLAAGGALLGLAALLAVAAPVLLLPLFYRVRRLPPGDLPDRLTALASRAGAPVLGVYEWVLGDKSRVANAALVGMGPTRRILLSDTLLEQYTPDEIEVVIAHELAHHVFGDLWKGVLLEAVQGTAALFAAHLVLRSLGPSLGLSSMDDIAGMPLLALVAAGGSVAMAPLQLAQSRRHERRADRFALDLTSKAEAFVSAMRRLGVQNLADETPSRVSEVLFHSHPPMSERIASARAWADANATAAGPG